MKRPQVRIGAVLALALAAGFVAWLVIHRSNNSATGITSTSTTSTSKSSTQTTTQAQAIGPIAVSRSGLANLARSLHRPIYWAGPRPGFNYEVTQTTTGKMYVRYLPPGVQVGDKRARFLIIATYPFSGALPALEKVAANRAISLPAGGIAFVDPSYPKSVHMAFPGVDYQVEVFDPLPRISRRIAVSGNVRTIG
jgi:hypothetical protein